MIQFQENARTGGRMKGRTDRPYFIGFWLLLGVEIEWGVQNEPITKKQALPVTNFFFRKFCFSLRTLCKELI